jgi:hypothetical protein
MFHLITRPLTFPTSRLQTFLDFILSIIFFSLVGDILPSPTRHDPYPILLYPQNVGLFSAPHRARPPLAP